MIQTIGKIPEFTEDAPDNSDKGKEAVPEAPEKDEKDTPAPPEEKPADEEIASEDTEPSEEQKAIQKLQEERTKLLREIKELKGTKRELKEKRLEEVQQHIDDLKDMHPDDVTLIDRVLRAKGYVTKEEAGKMFYEAVKQEELEKFLNKYPEYKTENDPDNIHWGAFERQIEKEKELGYSLPKNPHNISAFLERVHNQLSPTSKGSDRGALQRRVQVASVGAGGHQQSPSPKRLDDAKRTLLLRGGWSEDEIKKIEEKLPE